MTKCEDSLIAILEEIQSIAAQYQHEEYHDLATKALDIAKHTTAPYVVEKAIDLLRPIADQNWHGKWRIQKALEILRQHNTAAPDVKGIRQAIQDAIACTWTESKEAAQAAINAMGGYSERHKLGSSDLGGLNPVQLGDAPNIAPPAQSSEIRYVTLEELESRISGWEECIEIEKPNAELLIEAWNIIMGLYRIARKPEPVSSVDVENHIYDKIEDMMAEFEHNPKQCLSIIGEYIGLARHHQLHAVRGDHVE